MELPTARKAMLTLDVEDWEHANFSQLEANRTVIAASVRERRYAMDQNTDRWIEILAERNAKSTCFVLGEFAERFPDAVKRLAKAGHEIACHGLTHDLVYTMKRSQFSAWLDRAVGILGDLTGERPIGFRAPSWSVDSIRTPWLCDELEAKKFWYDSSEFPIQTPLYGQAGAPLLEYRTGNLTRIPVTVLTIGLLRVPFASGAFFRLMPLPVIRFGLKRAEKRGQPVMVVLHPRELDPAHPRLPLKGWEARVHYARLGTTIPKLRSVLSLFSWTSIRASRFPDRTVS